MTAPVSGSAHRSSDVRCKEQSYLSVFGGIRFVRPRHVTQKVPFRLAFLENPVVKVRSVLKISLEAFDVGGEGRRVYPSLFLIFISPMAMRSHHQWRGACLHEEFRNVDFCFLTNNASPGSLDYEATRLAAHLVVLKYRNVRKK